MPTVIIEVSSDDDIAQGRYVPYDLSMSRAKLVFKDSETAETVQILYWTEESGISCFPNSVALF